MSIFAKDANVRLTDTIDYILGRCPVPERPAIRRYLQSIVAKYQNPASLSSQLSTKGVSNAGDETTREIKRAPILIRYPINPNAPGFKLPTQVMAMSPVDVRIDFDALLPKFRIWATQEENDWRLIRDGYDSFAAHPMTFLQNNKVLTASGPNRKTLRSVETYRFLLDYPNMRFKFTPVAANSVFKGGIDVQVAMVPEVYWFDVPGRGNDPQRGSFGQIMPTELAGANVMVTSGFTGCSFIYKRHGGQVYAAHVNPGGANDGAGASLASGRELAFQLLGMVPTVAPGKFVHNALSLDNLQVFGKKLSNVPGFPAGYDNADDPQANGANVAMKVFGFRQNGRWVFYSQENTAHTQSVRQLP